MDDVLWNKFKKKCVNNDVTMKGQLSYLIKEYLKIN